MDVVLHPHSLTCKIFITDKFPVICNEVSGFFLDAAFYARLNITMCDYPQWHIPQSQCYKDLIYYFISTF